MAPSDGWYLVGPLLVVGLVALLATVMRWSFERDADPRRETCPDGLAIFGGCPADRGDFGLLDPVAVTDDPELAGEIRGLLADAGIRSTYAMSDDGQVVVLVFTEQVENARRLMGGSPAL